MLPIPGLLSLLYLSVALFEEYEYTVMAFGCLGCFSTVEVSTIRRILFDLDYGKGQLTSPTLDYGSLKPSFG